MEKGPEKLSTIPPSGNSAATSICFICAVRTDGLDDAGLEASVCVGVPGRSTTAK